MGTLNEQTDTFAPPPPSFWPSLHSHGFGVPTLTPNWPKGVTWAPFPFMLHSSEKLKIKKVKPDVVGRTVAPKYLHILISGSFESMLTLHVKEELGSSSFDISNHL